METTSSEPKRISSLDDARDTTRVGDLVQVGEKGSHYFAIYRRINANSAWSKRRAANGENPYWFMEKGEFVR